MIGLRSKAVRFGSNWKPVHTPARLPFIESLLRDLQKLGRNLHLGDFGLFGIKC